MKRIALAVILAGLAACQPAFNDKVKIQELQRPEATQGLPSARLYMRRDKKPEAVVLLSLDSPVADTLLTKIKALPLVKEVKTLSF